MFLLYNVKTLQCCVVQSYIRAVLPGRGAAADWRWSVVTGDRAPDAAHPALHGRHSAAVETRALNEGPHEGS